MQIRIAAGILVVALSVSLSACAPTGDGAKAGGSGGGSSSGSGSKSGSDSSSRSGGSTATLSGALQGTASMVTCPGGGSDGWVVVASGSSDKLPGGVSASSMDFTGPDSIYHLDSSSAKPTALPGDTGYDVDGVVLTSVIDSSKSVTLHGKLVCP